MYCCAESVPFRGIVCICLTTEGAAQVQRGPLCSHYLGIILLIGHIEKHPYMYILC